VIQIPQHLKLDYDSLSPAQQQKFMELAHWGAAGSLGNLIITDASFERIFNSVKQMGEDPLTPAQPDTSVNHDWDFDPKQNKGL
jgi:hypothetical protein